MTTLNGVEIDRIAILKYWVQALRSGNYQQGRRRLRETVGGVTRYCCLGVLCDLGQQGYWDGDDYVAGWRVGEFGTRWYPPRDLELALGIEDRHLASMNDEGKTFDEIADWIETHLIGEDA